MDTRNLLSRRSMLKASTYLAAAVITVPALAQATPIIPEVLTVLLAEYETAARADAAAKKAVYEAEDARDRALNKSRPYLPWECGDGARLPWLGRLYSGSVDPWKANDRLSNARVAAIAAAAPEQLADVRRQFRNKRRQLQRQLQRYASVEASFGVRAKKENYEDSYFRFSDAQEALKAYRPSTVEEVREIARVLRHTPTSHGSGFEWILATMLGVAEERA